MTKRKLTKHEDDIRRNLRKSAEINAPQSPHDGIHTCSKGCKKSGCNRGLRDTIEEQDAQIEALKQDLKEQAAAVRHLRMERVHDLNHIGGLQEENADLKAEIDTLMTNPTSRLLRAEREENARLNNYIERLEVRNAELVPENARLKAEVERLRKAGDAMADKASLAGCSECFGMFNDLEKSLDEWNAAKEGKPSV